MLTRMLVMVDRESEPEERYALVLMSVAVGTDYGIVCKHDNYAMCDYWATMYNLGRRSAEEVKESLSKGYEGVPEKHERQDAERQRVDPTYGSPVDNVDDAPMTSDDPPHTTKG